MKKNLVILIIVAVLATVMYLITGYSQTKLVACTEDAKLCPDGSAVGRAGPKCEFTPCPTPANNFCGGIAGIECSDGYSCQYEGDFPDAGGTCVKNVSDTTYKCPSGDYVDCMPGPNNPELKWECSSEFLQWAQVNCPDFKGVAY